VGLGVLDVRDFADGVVRVAEKGRSGQRYILSGDNVTFTEFLTLASDVAGVKPPRWTLPVWLVKTAICLIRAWSRLRGKPAPVAAAITELLGAYAWYNADLARKELAWSSRPLRESIEDSLSWMKAQEQSK
jgi:dihydroflavonol-4-reductase